MSNKKLGSMMFSIIWGIFVWLGIKIFGLDFLDSAIYSFVLTPLSYFLVGAILRGLGIWRY